MSWGQGGGGGRERLTEKGLLLRTRTSRTDETPAIDTHLHSHTTLNGQNLKKKTKHTHTPLFLPSWVPFIILLLKDIKWTATLIKPPYRQHSLAMSLGTLTGPNKHVLTRSHSVQLCPLSQAWHTSWYPSQEILHILTDAYLMKIVSLLQVWASFRHLSSLGFIFPTLRKKAGETLLMHKTLCAPQMKARIPKCDACLLPLLWWKVAAFCSQWD